MPRKNPIAPFEETPEGIKEFQKVQPFPVFDSELTSYKKRQANTTLSWETTRNLVYERDKGICDVCKANIGFWYYHCGHIVDRVCGGSDRLENLVCMCRICNLALKPLHETKEEYEEWKSNIDFSIEGLKKMLADDRRRMIALGYNIGRAV